MPHKYTTTDVLARLREEIARCDREINHVRSIARKDREGIEAFLVLVKKFLDSAREKKDVALDGLMEDRPARRGADGSEIPGQLFEARIQEMMAHDFRGQEKAFSAVIDLFENTDRAVDIYVAEREHLTKQLEYYQKLEQRKPQDIDPA